MHVGVWSALDAGGVRVSCKQKTKLDIFGAEWLDAHHQVGHQSTYQDLSTLAATQLANLQAGAQLIL